MEPSASLPRKAPATNETTSLRNINSQRRPVFDHLRGCAHTPGSASLSQLKPFYKGSQEFPFPVWAVLARGQKQISVTNRYPCASIQLLRVASCNLLPRRRKEGLPSGLPAHMASSLSFAGRTSSDSRRGKDRIFPPKKKSTPSADIANTVRDLETCSVHLGTSSNRIHPLATPSLSLTRYHTSASHLSTPFSCRLFRRPPLLQH